MPVSSAVARPAVLALTLAASCGRYGFSAHDDAPPDTSLGSDGRTSASDASRDAVPPDAPGTQPKVELYATGQNAGSAAITIPFSVPPGTQGNLFMTVVVAIGGQCATPAASATVTSIAFGSAALAQVNAITGTACSTMQTRSEVWALSAPSPGVANTTVQLSGGSESMVVAIVLFSGIDPATPVRASATASGSGTSSTVTVASAVGDLAVDFVGQGTSVSVPATADNTLFLDNVSTLDTLDNIGASTVTSAGSSVTMGWDFGASDEWQTIALSLVP